MLKINIIIFVKATLEEDSNFNPSVGSSSVCFVDTRGRKQLILFHLPVFIILLANLAGFIFCLKLGD